MNNPEKCLGCPYISDYANFVEQRRQDVGDLTTRQRVVDAVIDQYSQVFSEIINSLPYDPEQPDQWSYIKPFYENTLEPMYLDGLQSISNKYMEQSNKDLEERVTAWQVGEADLNYAQNKCNDGLLRYKTAKVLGSKAVLCTNPIASIDVYESEASQFAPQNQY